jgi:hypothetical protein
MCHLSIIVLVVSIGLALAANTTRALDFRYTRRAAYARWKKKESDHDTFQDKAEKCGKWTWRLFYCQTVTLFVGALLLCLSIWIGYGHRI